MLKKEAEWFGKKLKEVSNNHLGTILDVGSGSLFFRTIRQYWIDSYVFLPLRRRGVVVFHSDSRLDVVAETFVRKAKRIADFRTVFAFNLLEHTKDYQKAAKNLSLLVPRDGFLFVSCPKEFPYHPDPVDNMFRPGVEELSALFPRFKVERKTVIKEKYILNINRKAGIFFNKEFSVTCLVLQKK